ncbi:asparagine synthase (glutamine-hydrolyzing) [Acetatifactor muris]|uniref:asparagine synthase (glutamine-hydrolyzing) n=1 Tax=Acetatifactor muris TaxID=879566 RepID=A0A2K4ZCH6_9FIRM|nr:asparagine synthase (glutamine-hydrolyzing) [Acetatifactor muris]MCR2046577.1 asparagine synthase (glutamine-hydrolyzing) [Acetatifactor muris]SOY28166.1 Asparagine synthetase [glutamine-hydrolyzing] 1 [Acetatifactor muris]
MEVQRHRGPDDQGIVAFRYDGTVKEAETADKLYGEGNFDGGFGFNRLSIKDLSIEGHQPMLSGNKKVILVFNGEIYNDVELRKELINKGYNFRSTTDTEVILKMYEEYGFEQMIGRLNGMFAIVIMDLRTNFLYMARDRFGIKPLYYSDIDGKIYFASELKSLIQFKGFKRELDFDAFNARIIFSRPSDKVLLKNVNMLAPGWALIVSPDGNVRRWQFWNIDHYERQNKYKNIDDAIEALDCILADAVERQLVSDVKVGCQVSGGIDSTLVSYYANKADVPNLNAGVSIVDNTQAGRIEEHYIDIVSNTLNLEEHKFRMDEEFFINNYERASWCNDAPIYKPFFLSFYLLAKQAKNYVTVLMSGEGSDETAGGYGRFAAGVFQPFMSKFNLRSGSLKSYDSYAEYEVMSDSTILGFTAKDYDNTAELIENEIDRFNEFKGSNFTKHLKYETMYRLPESCLRQDKMTMASSIENRVPLLDNDVVDFIMELPESMLLHFKEGSPLEMGDNPFEWIDGKYIYKELLARKFGHDFVYRKKGIMVFDEKTLLACTGFKTLFYNKIFPSMKRRNVIDYDHIEKLYRNLAGLNKNEFNLMWRVIGLETWCQQFID